MKKKNSNGEGILRTHLHTYTDIHTPHIHKKHSVSLYTVRGVVMYI